MLVFSAITPHPPIIIPSIGKENLNQVKKTVKSMEELEKNLYASKPEIILIISPHGVILPESFSINLNNTYQGNFQEFGDFSSNFSFVGDLSLVYNIKERMEKDNLPLVLTSEEELDHGNLVPLYYLTHHLKNFSLIPVGYSLLDFKTHFKFGQNLRKEIEKTNKRVAVIASGDLSHCLTKGAPAGFSKEGKIFDKKLVNLIKEQKIQEIVNLNPELVEKGCECGFRSFLILLGILDGVNYKPEILSYEGPFGVGYLVANMRLN